jgi:hypothetical protein
MWDGAGCPTLALACNDDSCGLQSEISVPVVAGGTYMIQVGGYNGAMGVGTLTVATIQPPANDDCANAESISGEGHFAFDSTMATTDGVADSGCTGGQIDLDVWFRWTAPWDGDTTISTCSLASFDTHLAAYDDYCPTGNSLACNDDSCGLRSSLMFTAVAGEDYLLRVGSYVGSPGGPGAIEVAEGGLVSGCSNPSLGPDVIVGNVHDVRQWGSVGGITGYSLGATACNIGDVTMPWEGGTNHHPVIAQNLYRLENGRFQQLGLSWVKHGYASATEDYCCTCIDPGGGQIMGIGCADTYGASINGDQVGFGVGGLGPRSEVNGTTGEFPFPYGTMGQSGDAIYKRLQVANVELEPALHPGASYFAEVHYVNPDDADAGHGDNNASWRPVTVGAFNDGGWALNLTDITRPMEPALFAWAEADPQVTIETVDVPGDGRYHLGSRATDNGDGTWHYEYAVHNLSSERAAAELRLALPAGAAISGAAFHGVTHHSGEPYDDQDWEFSLGSASLAWRYASPVGTPGQQEPNALRWGTLFTFRFDAAVPPVDGTLDLDLLAFGGPGEPDTLHIPAQVPDAGCGAGFFCVATENSTGDAAAMDYAGSLSMAANDLVLLARQLPAGQFGIFYYGPLPAEIPFGNGNRCVAPGGLGLFRLQPLSTGTSGSTALALDNTSPPQPAGQLTAASTWCFQFWFRDPAAGGSMFNLSNGLEASFCL